MSNLETPPAPGTHDTMDTDPTNATLIERVDLTDTLSIVKVRPDSGRMPPFKPGQFFRLGLPKPLAEQTSIPRGGRPPRIRMTRRAYSIASSPKQSDYAEFFVVRIDEGSLTPRLWEIEVGGRLWMEEQAKGEFTMDVAPPDKDLVMVSTGTGIAPFISMLRTFHGENRWRRFVLIHGARYVGDLGYREEIARYVRGDERVRYIPLITREPADVPFEGLRGRVQAALEPATYERLVGAPLTPAECHVFLCGNPEMIDGVQVLLETRGFITDSREGPGNLHFERYW
ncbi:MAG: ferredoxin--NADP reductase [Phycisphaerales bacterium]|nr:ferredoxin--NADP reductase [Phycisphaerales bacterium]